MRPLIGIVVSCTLLGSGAASQQPAVVVMTGGTVIDGNGGPPLADAVIVLAGNRITAVGPLAATTIPGGATIIDARGKFLMPGLVDTNVHLSLYGGTGERYETLAKYHPRQQEIVLEAAQLQLKHGVTTVRDSYGLLAPLAAVRDHIAAGAVVTIGTDNYWAAAPEFTRGGSKPETQNHGIGSVIAVEGLVELGMTPAQAIVAATKNGAIASRGLADFGTLEAGKRADLLVLDANPLVDISNLRRLSTVMRDGKVVDRNSLPARRVLSR